MPQTSTYAGTSKTASDAAFYAGFAKGFTSGLEGIILFLSRKELRAILLQSLEILKQGQLFYVLACLLLFLLFKDPADDWGTLIWTFWRWGRIVSVVVTLILDRRFHANSKMFFTALKAKHPAYGDALETMPPVRRTAADHVQKIKRVAKVGAIRCLRACIKYAWPSAAQFVLPIMEFSSIRPVLGTAIASAITLTHFVPDSLMEATSVDEVISSFGEAIIDADNLGHDATRDFNRRIESPEVKEYFQERYRGYLVGSGFFNSLLMQIPFLGIPLTLISRCAAAVVVVDIVERNLEKDHRKPLPCEDILRESSHYPESKTTKQA